MYNMERRNFLKNIFGLAISLSPAATIIEKLLTPIPAIESAPVIKSVGNLVSKPFLIQINNPTSFPIYNFDTFGSFKYLGSNNFSSDGKLTINEGEIKSNSDVSYQEMLYSLMSNPQCFERVYLCSDNSKQISEGFIISTQDANGNICMMPVKALVSPYGHVSKIVDMNLFFMIDGFTTMQIPVVHPNTEMKIYLYPAANRTRKLIINNET